jgi:hypothetical protein
MNNKNEKRIILGAPYVFARQKLRKPSHVEVITLVQKPALCHNGCGLYYVPNVDLPAIDAVCPDCSCSPKPWNVGEPDEIEVRVHMAFGNVIDVAFLRSIGPLTRRAFTPAAFESRAVVTDPLLS